MYGIPHDAPLIGRNLWAIEPSGFCAKRAEMVERLLSTGRSAVVREIVGGRQIVSHFLVTAWGDLPGEQVCMGFHEFSAGVLDRAADQIGGCSEPWVYDWGPLGVLTKREMEVLVMICEGKTAADIAADLHRTEETVKSHKASLLRKLGCENSVQLAKIGWLAGLTRRDVEVFSRS